MYVFELIVKWSIVGLMLYSAFILFVLPFALVTALPW